MDHELKQKFTGISLQVEQVLSDNIHSEKSYPLGDLFSPYMLVFVLRTFWQYS